MEALDSIIANYPSWPERILTTIDLANQSGVEDLGELREEYVQYMLDKYTETLNSYIAAVQKSYPDILDALHFYADPETYFAISLIPDPPCGDFIEDFSETPELGMKPGKKAREVLNVLLS
jgi:hypothetical protein